MARGVNNFQPQRLLSLMRARCMKQLAIAEAAGVRPPAVSKWVNGTQAPDADALERLAKHTRVSAEWFTRPVGLKRLAPLYRNLARAYASDRERLQERLQWLEELVVQLSEFVEFPKVVLPTLRVEDPRDVSDRDIEWTAETFRELLGLGFGPVPNVVLALENAGMIVSREFAGIDDIEGLSAWSETLGRPLISLVADKENGFRSRFDAAHEAGHALLHSSVPTASYSLFHDLMEEQAHRFAGAFLLPARSFANDIRLPISLDSLILLKRRWGVSIGAMIMRLFALGIIDAEEKQRLFKRRSYRWGAKVEPEDESLSPESPRLLKRTIDLLSESGTMQRTAVSSYFGISSRDIESLCGLPENYLGSDGEVIDLAKLKSRDVPSRSAQESRSDSGVVIPFRRADPRV